MKDEELRIVLEGILSSIQQLYSQANEAMISAHSIRMAIAEKDDDLTVRIRKQYLRLELASKPLVADVISRIEGLVRKVNPDERRNEN